VRRIPATVREQAAMILSACASGFEAWDLRGQLRTASDALGASDAAHALASRAYYSDEVPCGMYSEEAFADASSRLRCGWSPR
jgi:hypothetical protein